MSHADGGTVGRLGLGPLGENMLVEFAGLGELFVWAELVGLFDLRQAGVGIVFQAGAGLLDSSIVGGSNVCGDGNILE